MSEMPKPLYMVLPMPINENGQGPEMDTTKVVKTVYQVWDENCVTVAEFDNEADAVRRCEELVYG